jgi:predicted lipoprotein with Yx(FWY)xxD motif
MGSLRTNRFRLGGVASIAFVALAVAACGSSSGGSTSSAAPAAAGTASATAAAAAGKGISISMTKGSPGTYLTGPSGRAIYLWVADTGDKSSCSGACAKVWPPVITKGTPIAASGVTASDLGTTKRSDGSTQVTYKNHPLYYYISDTGSGMTTGQGSDSFGAKWWLVTPAGAAITTGASGSSPVSSSSSSSRGY